MKKKIVFGIILLTVCCAVTFVFFQDKERIQGFGETSADLSLNNIEKQRLSIYKNIKHVFEGEYFGFERLYFPEDRDDVYYFAKRSVYVYDQNYIHKYTINNEQLEIEDGFCLGHFLGEYAGKMWFTVGKNDEEYPDLFYTTDKVIEISCNFQRSESCFHDLGQYTSIAINKSDGHAYVFRKDQGYYETYDLNKERYIEKINVNNLEKHYVHEASYNDQNGMILVGGGVISKDCLTIFNKSKSGCVSLWGSGGKVFFNNKSTLLSYDPLTKEKKVVYSPGNFVVSGLWEKLIYAPQEKDVIIFDYTFHRWLSDKTVFGRLILDTNERKCKNLILGHGKEI